MSEHPIPSERSKPVDASLDREADKMPTPLNPKHKPESNASPCRASFPTGNRHADGMTTTPLDSERLLTFRQGCDFLHLSQRRLWELVRANQVPHLRLGRLIRFRRSALIGWTAHLESESGVANG